MHGRKENRSRCLEVSSVGATRNFLCFAPALVNLDVLLQRGLIFRKGAGIESVKIPITTIIPFVGKKTVKYVLPGGLASERELNSWTIHLPRDVRKKRLLGGCDRIYVAPMK